MPPIRPLEGATPITGTRGDAELTSTLGLPVVVAEALYFITAGHGVGDQDSLVGQPNPAHVAGLVDTNWLAHGQDIALVRVVRGVSIEAGGVRIGQNTIHVVWNRTERPDDGDEVTIQGAVSGTVVGTVVHNNADINEPNTGQQLRNVVLVRLNAGQTVSGDSGSPVLSGALDGAQCWGIHGGRIQSQGEWFEWFTPFDNIEWATNFASPAVDDDDR